MLTGVGPSVALGRDIMLLREILDKAAERIDEGLESQPEVQADLRVTISRVYAELGEYAKAEEMLRKAAAAYRRLFGNEHLELARALNGLAGVLAQGARMDEAEVLAREGWNIRKKLLGQEHPDLADSLNNLALVLWRKGRLGEAEAMFRQGEFTILGFRNRDLRALLYPRPLWCRSDSRVLVKGALCGQT
jgi:tetratricopeptide (TPR) repeat protein